MAVGIGVVFAFIVSFKELISLWKSNYIHKLIHFSKSSFAPKGQRSNELSKLPINVLQPVGPLFFGSMEPLFNLYSNIFYLV